jgi:transcription elongation GreA/GreB family factor
MNEKNIKEKIYQQLCNVIGERITALQQEIQSVTESQDNETKSSAGDKYETGRAMMQQELDKNEEQLSNAMELKLVLEKINLSKTPNKVELGSLIMTNQGNYFLSIGFGKVEIEGQPYYAISQGSPIGKLLLNKKVGDKLKHMDKEFEIKELV